MTPAKARLGQWCRTVTIRQFLRFVAVGLLQNAIAYAIYIALNTIAPYGLAFTVAFTSGVLMSYVLNRSIVFRTQSSLATILPFVALHGSAYLLAIGLLMFAVEAIGLPEWLAPLLVSAALVWYTFLGSRFVLTSRLFTGQGQP